MEKKPLIGLLICMLMIISTILPVAGIISSEKTSPCLSIGHIFYVGGLGPNNYTKIQDAIDDSTFGDTVYVYDDSSPYREFIVIDKSISLIGENKDTTIIEGYNKIRQPILQINANSVHLHGFTIQNSTYISSWPSEEYHAIAISSNNNDISGNILTYNAGGIFVNHSLRNKIYENTITNGTHHCQAITQMYGGNNEIFNNRISGVELGIAIYNSPFNEIHGNSFSHMGSLGVIIVNSPDPDYSDPWYLPGCNKIYKNYISGAENGIALSGIGLPWCYFNFIYRNEIINCQYGIYRTTTSFIFISENNFVNNTWNAYFYERGILNQWSRNYWDDWNGSGYYTIHGETDPMFDPEGDPVPIEQYDKHPARSPYDI
jgi:parallel beta-helix repeat protein